MINCLSIDLEDWFCGIESIKFSDWSGFESRIMPETEKLLGLLDEYDVKATFFVLGYIAEKYPEIIRKVSSAGHEIALHGYSHQLVYDQSHKDFELDLKKALDIVGDIAQKKIVGYRAPLFSVTEESLWAMKILYAYGIRYDCSIYPFKTSIFGIKDSERYKYEIELAESEKIIELPSSTVRILGRNIPFAGGFFLRFWHYNFIKWAIRTVNSEGSPAVIYIHPFDLDPEIPVIEGISAKRRFVHYHNIRSTERKLNALLSDFEFQPIGQYLKIL
ncbi:MAG: XrtA system polysaccharide deacetylase [Elusimicrobiota bacterium]